MMGVNFQSLNLRWFKTVSSFVLLMMLSQSLEVRASSFKKHPRNFNPDIIKFCVNQLLYEDTFPNGNPVGDRTIIDPASAARACKGVSAKADSIEIKRCVNGLLYKSVFNDGTPAGERTIFEPSSAAQACQYCHDGNHE